MLVNNQDQPESNTRSIKVNKKAQQKSSECVIKATNKRYTMQRRVSNQ